MGRSHVLSLVIAAALAASLRSQDDAPNVESLVLGARTDEGRARAQAIDAMYRLGPRAVAWLPALARLAADSDLPVRSLAIRLMRGVLTSAGDAVAETALNADAEDHAVRPRHAARRS